MADASAEQGELGAEDSASSVSFSFDESASSLSVERLNAFTPAVASTASPKSKAREAAEDNDDDDDDAEAATALLFTKGDWGMGESADANVI